MFVSHHTLKWTRTCRSHGRHPHAHTAHFLLNRHSVDRTWDNGTEASLHMLVDEALGMLTYFADPYSSWQRGGNENRNGRIRRYLPKGTSFEDLTQDELDAIVGEINDTPMKLLGYKTPNEVWDEEMAKLQSKQADPKPAVALTN